MAKLVWRVKLVALLEPGVATETELACIERGQQVSLAELGLRLAEAKQLTAARQGRGRAGAGGRLRRMPWVRAPAGEPIATSFVESAVDAIISWRMAKAQQMRWSKPTLQPFLDVRTAVLNDTLEHAFRRRHHGFWPASDDEATPAAAA